MYEAPPIVHFLALPITDNAIAIGNPRVANVIALGVLDSLGELCGRPALETAVETMAPARFRELNLEALGAGYALAEAAA